MNSVRQSLYLKYRPQRFGDLVGQEVVARTLRNAVRESRFAHAYLFTGIRGTGKTSAARILARAINCVTPEDGEPCGRCSACESVAAGRSLDVIEIDAATNRGIDEIRDLRERAQFLPSELRMKVYIIDEAHMLTTEAGNAFLKTLEEPPEHACFILATTEPHRLAETILSRCQRFDFRRIPVDAMAEHLVKICEQEGVPTTTDVMNLVAQAGSGSLRDAESLLDRLIGTDEGLSELDLVRAALGMADPGALGRLADAIASGDLAVAWNELHQLSVAGVEPRQLLRSLGALARDRQWALLAAGGGGGRFWLDLMDACSQGGNQLRRADDPWMALEVILLKVGAAYSVTVPTAPAVGAPIAHSERPRSPLGATPEPTVVEPVAQLELSPSPQALSAGGQASPASPPEVVGMVASDDDPGRLSSAPSAATAASADTPPVPDWQRRWPEVIQWAQQHHHGPFAALARETRASALSNDRLTVEVRYPWHLGQLKSPANLLILEQACRDILGGAFKVQLVLAGEESPEPPPDNEEPSALGLAMKYFPGSTVRKVDFHEPGRPPPTAP
ncbi:MAG: DNA polymerase III subunit gamma/tau [Candidatus Dormibacteria bacterium]